MKTRLKLFFKWGIQFEDAYSIEEKSERKVRYADSWEVENEIANAYAPKAEAIEFGDSLEDNVHEPTERKHSQRTKKYPE